QYVQARALAAGGDEAEAQQILDDLADYNRYDCVSTRRLRDWLIGLAQQHGITPARPDDPETRTYEPSPLSLALQAEALHAEHAGRSGSEFRVAAAAIDYYPREAKSFWQ